MATSPEGQATPIPIPPGLYYIAVASPGRFLHERLTSKPRLTITTPSVHPNEKQLWQVKRGRRPGTITIARPGDKRPPTSVTFEGHDPKPGAKLVVHLEEFSTDWLLVPTRLHRYYIRVPPRFPPPRVAEEGAKEPNAPRLGFAVAPERINPPFLELDFKEQLEWAFQPAPHPHGEETYGEEA